MNARAKKLLDEVLDLPTEERDALAAKLLEKLDAAPDSRTDAEWAAEIERRSTEARDPSWKVRDKVTDALVEAVGAEAQIELEDVAPDKIGGIVLSGTFAEMSVLERQDHIWKSLDAHLDTFERTRVVFIVADTPEEYEALKKAAG